VSVLSLVENPVTPSDQTVYRFGEFVLEVANRRLLKGNEPIELNSRYFDALALLVREHGQLVSKERFFLEVWDDVVVSESALTQCIKHIRIHLNDAAADPRFVATVPRHGYRFVAPVERVSVFEPEPEPEPGRQANEPGPVEQVSTIESAPVKPEPPIESRPGSLIRLPFDTRTWAREGTAVVLGGAVAGLLGGLLYGAGLAYSPASPDLGTASVLLVLLSLSTVLGLLGGIGVGFGMATARAFSGGSPGWSIMGATLGGLAVGSVTKLLGVDGFNLFFGRAPTEVTGGPEGAVLGAALAIGLVVAGGAGPWWRPVIGAGVSTAAAGAIIPAVGGNLLGGSLEHLARTFTGSRLELDALGRFFGELHFGETTQVVLGGLEGLLFGIFVAAAWVTVVRRN
jgi:DNA-binding winged helix-turn-helix (wHTH) protein